MLTKPDDKAGPLGTGPRGGLRLVRKDAIFSQCSGGMGCQRRGAFHEMGPMSGIMPVGNNLLVRVSRVEKPKVGSFLMADTTHGRLKEQQGLVIATGPRVKNAKPGMLVVYGRGTAIPIRDDLAFVNERHLIGEIVKA